MAGRGGVFDHEWPWGLAFLYLHLVELHPETGLLVNKHLISKGKSR